MKNSPCFICSEKDKYRVVCELDPARRIIECACGLQSIYPKPTMEELDRIYSEDYYDTWGVDKDFDKLFKLKLKTSMSLLKRARRYLPPGGKRHLDIGCAFGYMLEAAGAYGYESEGIEISHAADEAIRRGYNVKKSRLKDADYPAGHFDLITAVDVIEHIIKPVDWIKECFRILKKGGVLLLVTPDCSSLMARIKKSAWPHYKAEHIYYYSPETIRRLLKDHGFSDITCETGIRYLSLDYVADHYTRFQRESAEARAIGLLRALSPKIIRSHPVPFPSEMTVIGEKK